MMKDALKVFIFFLVLTGLVYPLSVTMLSQALFYNKANGSLLWADGKIVGAELIGQRFQSDKYFWVRPSVGGNAANPPSASNLGATSKKMLENADNFKKQYSASALNPELLTTSGSGLDPHLSLPSVLLQVERVANARNMGPEQKNRLEASISKLVEGRTWGFLGQERINVLKLNMALDEEKL